MTKFQIQFFKDNPGIKWPKCLCGCEENVLLNKTDKNKVFREFASAQCSRKSKTIDKAIENKLYDYNWLFDQRITQKKSKELIADQLNISITPVNKALKLLKIPDVKYNCSNHTTQLILDNKQQLSDDYQTGVTFKELAEQYKTSPATLSRFFARHNLDTRQSNMYPRKTNRVSAEEQGLHDWISSVYKGRIVQTDRTILQGKELDIYIPDKQLAIEYNGIYSHIFRPDETTSSKQKGPTYHLNKTLECNLKNIKLLHIFSDQWKSNRTAVETVLLSKLKLNERIFARKCQIRDASVQDKNIFLETFHLQGADRSHVRYGLYHQDSLVAVMTFGKPRFSQKYDWELIRFACHKGITVVGGFSKLLSHFRKSHQGSIISYADRMISNGNVYQKNGFTLVNETKPGYFWTDGTKIIARSQSTRKHLQNLPIFDPEKSQAENMFANKYRRFWDCGQLVFVL